MIPHTLVLEPGLRIYKIYSGYWFFGRPTLDELRLDLRAVLQRCRPDWGLQQRRTASRLGNGRQGRSSTRTEKPQAQVFAAQD
jgi:hypothetical protein